MTDAQRRTLEALCARIVTEARDAAGAPTTLAAAVEARLAAGDPVLRSQVSMLLTVFDSPATSLLVGLRVGRFSAWPAADQDAWLRTWEASALPPMRTIFQAFRKLILSTYYAHESATAAIGFLGPLYEREPQVAWEGALHGTQSDDEPIKRAPSAANVPLITENDAWREANRVPAGVTPGDSLTGHTSITADVCVVGSGAGGAVTAARLAERGFDVVLLEEGGYWTASDFTERESEMVPRLYADAGARATDDLSLSILQGRCIGGGTTINWMIMLRAAEQVLDEWAEEHGAEGMRATDFAPVYEQIEAEVHARFVPDDAHAPNNRIILDGARALSWHATNARINAKECVRAGFCGVGCRYGAKQSTLVTFMPRALAAGARVFSDVRVETVKQLAPHSGAHLKRVAGTVLDRATGKARGTIAVDAPIVVLSAGAVGTPSILQRSGLGGGGVGRFLRVHPTSATVGRYDREMYGTAGIPQSSLCDQFMAGEDGKGYGFWIECPALLPALASVAVPGFGAEHAAVMRDFTRLGSLIVLTRDGAQREHSSGGVSVDRTGRVHISYRMTTADRETLVRGIAATARLHFAAGAQEVTTLHSPMLRLRSEADIVDIASRPSGPNQLGLFTAHMNGTCRIGKNPATSGCTPDGERHGVPGLYVIDGSLFPTAPGVNPQETIMAMATILSSRIASRHAHI
ncbi:MAG: GMC family oxidoreductase [Gemmatimonadota bacterium]